MSSSIVHDNWKYISGAVLIHALLAALLFGMALSSSRSVVPQLAIRGVMVDRAMLNRLAQQQSQPATPPAEEVQRKQQEAEAAKQQELQRQQEQAAQAKAAQEKQLKEKQQQDQLRLETDAKQRAFQEQQRA